MKLDEKELSYLISYLSRLVGTDSLPESNRAVDEESKYLPYSALDPDASTRNTTMEAEPVVTCEKGGPYSLRRSRFHAMQAKERAQLNNLGKSFEVPCSEHFLPAGSLLIAGGRHSHTSK